MVRGALTLKERACVGDNEVSSTTLRPSGSLLSDEVPKIAVSYWPREPRLTRVDQSGSCNSHATLMAARGSETSRRGLRERFGPYYPFTESRP
jgi:hypothetical protein